ncbi:uncharacterized protein BDW43DRAFT_234019 [Aspergillus alliaceus]|uniref:uncharacterized protein n=1 Tax=Petromyces alliaceus TaxID=209559 RepID=UPI0012A4BB76|nr:uncharacterized protein BDW43DRAFT_234019 [Aspergillus alliaceus]KAB8227875.1 hypothetical protein BDW43DRAFT_234019 [Aspergillus alliaceus]
MANTFTMLKMGFEEFPRYLPFLRKATMSDAAQTALLALIEKGPYTGFILQDKLPWVSGQDKPGSPGSESPCSSPSPLTRSSGEPTDTVQQETAGSDRPDGLPVPSTSSSSSTPQQKSLSIQQTRHAAPATVTGNIQSQQQSSQQRQNQVPGEQPPALDSSMSDHLPDAQVGGLSDGGVQPQAPPPAGHPARPSALMEAAPQVQHTSWTMNTAPHNPAGPSLAMPGAVPVSYPGHLMSHGSQVGMPHPPQPFVNHPAYSTTLAYGFSQPHFAGHMPSAPPYIGPAWPSQPSSHTTYPQPGPQWTSHAGGFQQASTQAAVMQQADTTLSAQPMAQPQGAFVHPGQLHAPAQSQGEGLVTETDLYGLNMLGTPDHHFSAAV